MIINKYKLLENLENTYCIIGNSKVQGIGIIAIRDIPKGIDPLPIIIPEKVTNLAHLCDTSIEKCIDAAYNEIKDRKGKMANGTYVKNDN